MSVTYFDESKAPYCERATFIRLWNEMVPERRRNNIGLFQNTFDRIPTEHEIEQGILPNNPLTQIPESHT